jgi:hypothetical protein
MISMDEDEFQHLIARGTLQEHVFHSDVPAIGPLIARLRVAWNSISTKWAVRSIIQQQNQFNAVVVEYLRDLGTLGECLSEVDREQVALRRDLAELALQVSQMNRLLTTMNQQLTDLAQK